MLWPEFSVGPANQTQIPAAVHNLPSSIAPNASVTSNLIAVQGYTKVAAAATSSQNGVLSIQRFLDNKGAVPLGPPTTVVLAAGMPAALTVNDGQIFGSFVVIITNGVNATALLVDVAVAVAADPATPDGASSGSYDTATSTVIDISDASGGTILLGANPNAKYRAFRCPKTNTNPVWLMLGTNPILGEGLIDLQPGDIYEMTAPAGNLYQGPVTAIAVDNNQQVLVTEGV